MPPYVTHPSATTLSRHRRSSLNAYSQVQFLPPRDSLLLTQSRHGSNHPRMSRRWMRQRQSHLRTLFAKSNWDSSRFKTRTQSGHSAFIMLKPVCNCWCAGGCDRDTLRSQIQSVCRAPRMRSSLCWKAKCECQLNAAALVYSGHICRDPV